MDAPRDLKGCWPSSACRSSAGAVVGGAVALLLAPKSGRELRSELGRRMRAGEGGDNGERGATH